MKFPIFAALVVALMSCNSNTQSTSESKDSTEKTEVADKQISLAGQWRLIDYAGEKEMKNFNSDENYILTFDTENGTFGMQTDCNSLSGSYKTEGDSIKFDNIAKTLMACPNDEVEKEIGRILPMIDTYTVKNDTILALRADMRTMARFSLVK